MWTLTRRWLQAMLGITWLIDGILQLKPQMFTLHFINQVLLPSAQGQPLWIRHTIVWAANAAAPHIPAYNVIFAAIQLFLGLMLIANRWVKGTLIVSFVWTAVVWWFSEGFGMLFTGQATFLTGAPGAVLLYGLIGAILWPPNDGAVFQKPLVPERSTAARYALTALWALGGMLQIQRFFLTKAGLNGAFAVGVFNRIAAGNPVLVTLTFAGLMWLAAILLISHGRLDGGVWLSVLLALFIWWAGEAFGQMFSPLGTDPNSGPLLVLLALCAGTRTLNAQPSGDAVKG